MKSSIIRTSDLPRLLDAMTAAGRRVHAPIRRDGGGVLEVWRPGLEISLDHVNFTRSPKGLFLPQCETLYTYKDSAIAETAIPDEPFVLFGIRPCDARALACMDKLFAEFGGRADPYYQRRRELSVVVSLACNAPDPACFCTSVGGSPAGTQGADIAAYPVDDHLLLEAVTDKGGEFLDKFTGGLSALLEPATPGRLAARDESVRQAEARLSRLDLTGLKKNLASSFNSPVWGPISDICRGCGLCTYLCPTCHCFDITDEKKGRSGRRIRTWDSCQFALFTMHASGHNPRPTKKERMRQRILHKFQYTVDNVGEVFCAGCGRCVRNCPVNLDIREALQRLAQPTKDPA